MAEENRLTGVSSPDTSMYPRFQPMPQANPLAQIDQLQRLDLQNQALQQGQASLGLQRVNAVNTMLGTLITKPDLSVSDVTSQLETMVRNKIISPNEPAAIMQHLQPFANDPEGLRGALKNSYLQSLDHASKMQLAFGTPINQEKGGATLYGSRNVMNPGQVTLPGGMQSASGTVIPATPDPTEMRPGPVVRGAGGAPVQTSLPADVAVGIARGNIGYDTGPNGQIILKRPASGAPVGMPTVPSGAGEAAAVTAKGGAEMGTSIEKGAAGASTRSGMLNNLEDDLKKFDAGPLAGHSLALKRLYNDAVTRTGVPIPQWDPQSVAAQEGFNKQATQLAQQQFQALGGTGTDQQLGSSVKANPNEFLSNLGNKQIIGLLKGNEDAIRTMNDEWQKWKTKNGSESGGQFMTWFNNNFSPRAFQFARMNKADRAEMLQNMQPNERAALSGALKNAEDRGWIKPD
jgi:hypothetical protein